MAKMMTSKTLAEGGQDLETVDKAVNTVAVVKPRYGNTFKSIPLIAKEKAENNMFQPFVTEAELLKYIPILVPTVAKALDTHKVWFYGLDPNVTEVDQKPKWRDTGLSELEQAKEYSDTTVNPHLDLDRFLDKNGFVFAEFVDAIFEFYISLRTANIHTDNIVNSQVVNIDSPKFDVANLSLDVSEHGLIIKDGSGFFFSLEDILQHVDRINQLFNQANSIRKTVDTSKPLLGRDGWDSIIGRRC